jgi:putative endonuclease
MKIPHFFRKKSDRQLPKSAIVGVWGEQTAAGYLKKKGYRIIGCNVRPDRRDEIDIIARIAESLVFVEVKTRADENFGAPFSAVDSVKRHSLNRAAAAYLRKTRFPDLYYRFDVIEVIGRPAGPEPEIRHIEDAFPFEKRFKFPV